MKTSLQHLLISFGGSFIAVATFVGILLVVDKIWGDDEADEKRPLEEMVISYFDAHGVEYEKVDSCKYRFTYNDNIYFWKYYPEDSEFLQIIAFWEAPAKNQNELLALANQLNAEWKFIKILVDEENDVIITFEQVVNCSDVDAIISRGLRAFESCVHAFFKGCEKHSSE